jgi:hypothetical protein
LRRVTLARVDVANDPSNAGEIDTVVVLKHSAHDEGHGIRVFTQADRPSFEMFRRNDSAVGPGEQRVMAKTARRENRQRDVGAVPAGRSDQIVTERELRDVEFGCGKGAAEQAFELARGPRDVEAVYTDASIEERLGAVEGANRGGDFVQRSSFDELRTNRLSRSPCRSCCRARRSP